MNFNDYVKESLSECQTILNKKSNDYSDKDNLFSCFEGAGNIAGITPEQSILTLIGIKIFRLKELITNDKNPNFESIDDSIKDLINYSLLLGFRIKK